VSESQQDFNPIGLVLNWAVLFIAVVMFWQVGRDLYQWVQGLFEH
jgi:hypothetical protein